jgi:lactoylglutathione lyase
MIKRSVFLILILVSTLPIYAQKTHHDMKEKQFLGLRTVVYKVPDIDKATQWYSNVLGKDPYFEESFYVGFNVGGYELGLEPAEEDSIEIGTNEISYWAVEDVQATYQRLINLGARPHEEPQDVGEDIVAASVIDPWGNVIGIIYNPGFKAD